MQFTGVSLILAAVSAGMSVVNLFTGKELLLASTTLFSAACLFNIYLLGRGKLGRQISALLFCIELTALLCFFFVSGIPEGFSAIWACLVPPVALLLFQRKGGTPLCAVQLAILIFFFETPYGNSLLRYPYTESFRLRFPMLYLAFFLLAFFLETVRAITYDAMCRSRRQYAYLYDHDALTGLLNRYGFNRQLALLLRGDQGITLMVLDIDNFKAINDHYGHPGGDSVLQGLAKLLTQQTQGWAKVCRWGGEEFAVLCRTETDGETLAEGLRRAVAESRFQADGHPMRMTISIGVVSAPRGVPVRADRLVRQTDACLYRAKTLGRNRVVAAAYQDTDIKQQEETNEAEYL